MSSTSAGKYDFDIPEEGLSYDILDFEFNITTQAFIARNVNLKGMRILDVGCGSGIMTLYLSKMVGSNGHVTSIDISDRQLNRAKQYCDAKGAKNIAFIQMAASDIQALKQKFDVIYCRFVLHHLLNPREVINLFRQCLNVKGIYIAEEGLVNQAFAYPPSIAWEYKQPKFSFPGDDKDDQQRDGNFGMKLIYWMKKSGFTIQHANLVQPILYTKEAKQRLLDSHYAFKSTALEQGQTEQEWQTQTEAYLALINDDFSVVGFYESCQVLGQN